MKAATLLFVLALALTCAAQTTTWKPFDPATRSGHGSMVHSAAFGPDSKFLASADGAGTIVVWDLASGKPRYRIEDGDEQFLDPVISPDGRILAAKVERHPDPRVLLESSIRFWDAATGKVIGTLEGTYRMISDITFSPDSKIVMAEIDHETTVVWDTATRNRIPRSLNAVGPYAFDRTGTRLAAAAVGRKILLLMNAQTGAVIRRIPGFSFIASAGIDPAGRFVAVNDEVAAAADGSGGGMQLKVYTLATGKRVPGFDEVDMHPPVTFTGNGGSLVLLQFERTFNDEPNDRTPIGALYNPATGKKQKDIFLERPMQAFGVAYSPGGRLVALRSSSSIWNKNPDWNLLVFNLESGKEVAKLNGYSRKVTSLAYSKSGEELIAAYSDGRLLAWDTSGWTAKRTLWMNTDEGLEEMGIAILPGLRFATDGTGVFDLATGREIPATVLERSLFVNTAVSGDGSVAVSLGEGNISILTLPGRDLRNRFAAPPRSEGTGDPVVAIDRIGDRMAVEDGSSILMMGARDGKELSRFKLPAGKIGRIEFSPDGKHIAVANSEDAATDARWAITVFEIASGKTPFVHRTDKDAFAFSPNGDALAVLSRGDMVQITRLTDGKTVTESKIPIRNLTGPVLLAFHPNGRFVAAGSEYGIQVFDTGTGAQVARLK